MDIFPVYHKHQIRTGYDLLQFRHQVWVFCCPVRRPAVKKAAHRPGCGTADIPQNVLMLLFSALKTFPGSLRFSLIINSQHITGMVAQEIGRYTGRTGNHLGYRKVLGYPDCLFAVLLLFLKGDNAHKLPLL